MIGRALVLFCSILTPLVSTHSHHGDAEDSQQPFVGWTREDLDAKWGTDWGYTGISTFAHLDTARCLQYPETEYDIAILGVPFDTAVTYRPGARFGPRAIRQASARQTVFRGFNPRAMFNPYKEWATVIDCGDIPVTPFDNALGETDSTWPWVVTTLLLTSSIISALKQMSEAYTNLAYTNAPAASKRSPVEYRHKPKLLSLGGDHSIALPTLRALNKIYGNVAVVHFDAHLDTWHPAKYPSAWFDKDNPNEQSFFTHGTMFWLAHNESLIAKDKSVHAGLRTRLTDLGDYEDDTAQGWVRIACDDIDDIGADGIIKKIMSHVGTEMPVYLSIGEHIHDRQTPCDISYVC